MGDANTTTTISSFCSHLRGFCRHLDSMCTRLRSSVENRPPSLPTSDPESSSFLRSLVERAASTNEEVESLEAMTIDIISFQELLGHCMELYKQNENNIFTLEEQLRQYGYKPIEDENAQWNPGEVTNPKRKKMVADSSSQINRCELPDLTVDQAANCVNAVHEKERELSSPSPCLTAPSGVALSFPLETKIDLLEDDPMFSGSLSLQDLGLSAAGLACLTREESCSPLAGDSVVPETIVPFQQASLEDTNRKYVLRNDANSQGITQAVSFADSMAGGTFATSGAAEVLKDGCDYSLVKNLNQEEYNETPSWLKMQVSLEDLNTFISKLNDVLKSKRNRESNHDADYGMDRLYAEDLKSFNAESKVKAGLLVLVRIGRLTTEYQHGLLIYRLCKH